MHLGSFESILIDRELDGLGSRARAEVVHSSLQPLLPSIEMHARELTESGSLQMNIQALALTYKSAAICSHVDDFLLTDFPDSFVDSFNIVGYTGDIGY